MAFVLKYKPSVKRHNLLFIAGLAWTTAGGILFGRGLAYLIEKGDFLLLRLAGGVVAGMGFYLILFGRISRKHIKRIRGLNIPYPCAFSFFNFRSYLLMSLMIGGGILLRSLDLINRVWLYNFYIAMGLPLLVSATRFFYSWAAKKEIS
jgi:hypothetical protein